MKMGKDTGWNQITQKAIVNKIKLPKHIVDKLIELPESGMGYQIVNLFLNDGSIIKNVKIQNCSFIIVDETKKDLINSIIDKITMVEICE